MSSDLSSCPVARSSIASARAPARRSIGVRAGPLALLLAAGLCLSSLPGGRLGADEGRPGAPADPGAGVAAPATLALPSLANTAHGDRVLLREIDDGHVHVAPPPRDAVTGPSADAPAEAGDVAADAANADDGALVAIVEPLPASAAPPDAVVPVPTGALAPVLPGVTATTTVAATAAATAPDAAPAVGGDAPMDVWNRIRLSERLPERLDRPEVVAMREEYLAEGPWVTRILERGLPFIEHLVDALDGRYMPLGLAILPAIESGFRPDVLSSGNAAGLWQIVPITAEEIGLERSAWFDARADIVASTTAALDYLSYLNAEFHGDWELTLAAYNAGPGRVRGAIARNEAAGLPTDFWSLSLPPETTRYVPKVLALVSLLRETPSGIAVPDVGDQGFERVDVGLRISIDRAAALSGIPEADLRRLNAGLVHGVTAPEGPHALYLPRGASAAFVASIAGAQSAALYSLPLVHEVKGGETLSGIAERYGMTQRQLMELNALDGERLLAGQELAVLDVRRAGVVDVAYTVGSGDTLSGIAESHAVGVGDISRGDGSPLENDLIRPGDTLTIAIAPAGPSG